MYNIKLMNKISRVIYDYLPRSQFNVSSHLEDSECDAMIVRSAPLHDVEFPTHMLAIARAGAGTNNIPIERCTDEGIVVFNTPGANANAVKELVLGAMVAASRNLFDAYEWVLDLQGSPEEIAGQIEKGKGQFVGNELAGKTLGVIGLGAIGIRVANVAAAIGMDVVGYDPYLSVDHAWNISRGARRATELEDLLSAADFISIHVPLIEQTKNYLSAPEFSRMKPGVILLNLARGGLVKETSLFDALENGTVKKYVTDFPTAKMIGHKDIVSLPHLGASTPESEENCAAMAARELRDFLERGSIENSVNMPDCALAPLSHERLTIIHKNAPTMMGKITNVVAEEGINIADMVNKSRGRVAYTAINLDHPLTDKVKEAICAIPGVIKIRGM